MNYLTKLNRDAPQLMSDFVMLLPTKSEKSNKDTLSRCQMSSWCITELMLFCNIADFLPFWFSVCSFVCLIVGICLCFCRYFLAEYTKCKMKIPHLIDFLQILWTASYGYKMMTCKDWITFRALLGKSDWKFILYRSFCFINLLWVKKLI